MKKASLIAVAIFLGFVALGALTSKEVPTEIGSALAIENTTTTTEATTTTTQPAIVLPEPSLFLDAELVQIGVEIAESTCLAFESEFVDVLVDTAVEVVNMTELEALKVIGIAIATGCQEQIDQYVLEVELLYPEYLLELTEWFEALEQQLNQGVSA